MIRLFRAIETLDAGEKDDRYYLLSARRRKILGHVRLGSSGALGISPSSSLIYLPLPPFIKLIPARIGQIKVDVTRPPLTLVDRHRDARARAEARDGSGKRLIENESFSGTRREILCADHVAQTRLEACFRSERDSHASADERHRAPRCLALSSFRAVKSYSKPVLIYPRRRCENTRD